MARFRRPGNVADMSPWFGRPRCGRAAVGAVGALLTTLTMGCAGPQLQSVSGESDDPILTDFGFDPDDGRPPVRAHLSMPADGATDAEILMVMPDGKTPARDLAEQWADWAARDVIVVVPEFGAAPSDVITPDTSTPTPEPSESASVEPDDSYALGGMVRDNGYLSPESEWTWSMVDELIRQVRTRTGCPDPAFSLFGSGAGAQFVSRFVEFHDTSGLEGAVAANADWYTMPDDSARFPYGLDGVEPDVDDLAGAFASPLTVMVNDQGLPAEKSRLSARFGGGETQAQGASLLERGEHFYGAAERIAQQRDWPFAWQLVRESPDSDDEQIARAAMPHLFAEE